MAIKDTIRNEQTFLRAELQELKKCQLQYFILTLASTGVIFGLSEAFLSINKIESIIFLAPLVIIIPCWLTFFDKATTITRLVGYMRILEEQLSSQNPVYFGFENALAVFRENEKTNPPKTGIRLRDWRNWGKLLSLLILRTRHRYWIVNWYTFLILSIICCILPFFFSINMNPMIDKRALLVWTSIIVVLVTVVYTYRMVADLIIGKYSYDNVTEFWKNILLDKIHNVSNGSA